MTSNTGNSSIGDVGTPERVEVPRVSFLPCSYPFSQLQAIEPLNATTNFGKSLYCVVTQNSDRHLQTCCVNHVSQ